MMRPEDIEHAAALLKKLKELKEFLDVDATSRRSGTRCGQIAVGFIDSDGDMDISGKVVVDFDTAQAWARELLASIELDLKVIGVDLSPEPAPEPPPRPDFGPAPVPAPPLQNVPLADDEIPF